MPTLADLQALRSKSADPGIQLPAAGKTPTFGDLQALRSKAAAPTPEIEKPFVDDPSWKKAGGAALSALKETTMAIPNQLEATGRAAYGDDKGRGGLLTEGALPKTSTDAANLALPFIPGGPAKAAEETAMGRVGLNTPTLKAANTADKVQDLLKQTVKSQQEQIAGGQKIPDADLAKEVGTGLSSEYKTAKQNESQAHEAAKDEGRNIDATGLETHKDVDAILDQYGRGEIATRRQIHNLKTQGISEEELSDIDKLELQLKNKKLEAAEQKYDATGLPREIKSGEDLIKLKQFLNAENPANMTGSELKALQSNKASVDNALRELEKSNPQFAAAREKANALTETNAQKYQTSLAKEMGMNEDFIASATKAIKSGRPEVVEAATQNLINHLSRYAEGIKTTAQVDWLRANVPKPVFDKVMTNRVLTILESAGLDSEKLAAQTDLLTHIGDQIGLKGQKLRDYNALISELDNAKISLDMSPKEYRDLNSIKNRIVNLIKSVVTLGKSGPSSYVVDKGTKAALGSSPMPQENLLMSFRKKALGQQKPPKIIPGAAIGTYINSGSDQQ